MIAPEGAILYVDGCDVCLDPVTAHNVRANLVVVAGRVWLLPPGARPAPGGTPVFAGGGCLALYAPWADTPPPTLAERLETLVAAGQGPGQALAIVTRAAGGRAALWDGAPADFWLVPGGPLARVRAMAHPRLIVRGGRP